MATTAREGGGGGGKERERERERERKGSSSSNPQTKIKKPLTKPSNPSPSCSSNKPIPNYLKPTISSSLDPSSSSSSSRTIRRSTTFNSSSTSTTTTKPASVNRRRSLDKPPSSNNPQKTTNTRATASSSSSKTTLPSAKPAPQRSLSTLSSRPTKPTPASATPSIRRSLSTKATPSNSGLSPLRKAVKKTAPKKAASDSSVELEARDKDPLDHMIGVGQDNHELGMDDHEVASLPEISEMPGQDDQLGDPVMILPETAEEQGQEIATEKQADERNKESVEQVDGDDTEEKGAVEGVEEEDLTSVEEKHVVVVLEGSAAGEGSQVGEETKAVAGNKKETTQAYNDVIEETASKLMENRRNKVRALAGAFETVISLDSK